MPTKPKSGAEKRKIKAREREIISKFPKISSYLPSASNLPDEAEQNNRSLSEESITVEEILDEQRPGTPPPHSGLPIPEDQSTVPEVDVLEVPLLNVSIPVYESVKSLSNDPGLWEKITDVDNDFWLSNGPSSCQNQDVPFTASEIQFVNRTRRFTKEHFYGMKANDEKYYREWLLYSPSNGKVYCFFCNIFSNSKSQFATGGYCDWSNSIKMLKSHENSDEHRLAIRTWVTRSMAKGCIDGELRSQMGMEKHTGNLYFIV